MSHVSAKDSPSSFIHKASKSTLHPSITRINDDVNGFDEGRRRSSTLRDLSRGQASSLDLETLDNDLKVVHFIDECCVILYLFVVCLSCALYQGHN